MAIRPGLVAAVFLALASPGFSQSRGVVTAERTVIWRADSSIVATVVGAGVELELTGRSDRWYEAVIPASLGGRGERGLIAVNQVRLLDGSDQPPLRSLRGSRPTAQIAPPPSPPQPQVSPEPALGVRGFAQAGLIGFAADKSFAAVTGESYGATLGVGVQVRFRTGLYVQTSLERFRETGQRVFVYQGETYPLGISNTVTLQPVVVAVGYRVRSSDPVRPYVGGGIGNYHFKESSPFDDPGEEVDQWHLGYHVHAGAEFWVQRWFAPAVEVRYTTVPDALGTTGAAAEFGETDLGGWQVHAKVLIGR